VTSSVQDPEALIRSREFVSSLSNHLTQLRGKRVGVLTHLGGDQDSMWPEGVAVFASPDYKSSSEIVLDLCILNGRSLNAVESSALFFGIYYDTVRLTVADALTLRKVGLLGAYGAEPSDESEGFTDVVFRVSPEVVKTYSINVVRDVIGPLTSKLGGQGGGHAAAARVRVPGNFDEVVAKCLELLGYALGTYVKPIEDR